MNKSEAARLLCDRIEELARVSDDADCLTRTFLSPAMARANTLVGSWMKEAGLDVREDTVGNLIGRVRGTDPKAKTLLVGSHLDTVRNAGRFDGALGVLLPIVALRSLRAHGIALPYTIEVLGFSEEEGVRFASAYLGSEGYTGRLKASTLKLRDAGGVSVCEALEQYASTCHCEEQQRRSNPAGSPRPAAAGLAMTDKARRFILPKSAHARNELLGYIEVHIEQGPVLEAKNLSVGVVSAIAGQSRCKLTWTGEAGHAGTTPMNLRRDALAGAAEFVLAAEKFARGKSRLVATVGSLTVSPGAANVIPGEVRHTLDVRHPRDAARRAALRQLRRLATQIAKKRGLKCSWQRTQDNGAVECSPQLSGLLTRSVRAVQGRSLSLPSGAGHDAVVMSALTPVAMLFVRSRDGLSHHPDEFTKPADLGVALRVMIDFLMSLADRET